MFFGLVSLAIAVSPALAQQSPDQPKAPPAAASAAPEPTGAPTNPDLTVATVKLQGGSRISKLIGSAVYRNEKIGSLDDLILKDGNRIALGVVSVGGFLGMGNKLVAVPYDQLRLEMDKDQTKITMPGANKDALKAMPTFTYSG